MKNEVQVTMLGSYIKIETNDISISLGNTDIKELVIKKEDNGRPIILVESKQQ